MRLLLVLLAACGSSTVIRPSAPLPLPPRQEASIDTTPKARPRMMPPEVYLRAYMMWFGGLAPLDVQTKARGKQLFDAWDDYLAALGLPDYRLDLPRQTQTNSLMIATFGRLGEALCARSGLSSNAGSATTSTLPTRSWCSAPTRPITSTATCSCFTILPSRRNSVSAKKTIAMARMAKRPHKPRRPHPIVSR